MNIYHTATALKCNHCGQACDEILWLGDKSFCCQGCKTVFEILQENDLCEYYHFETTPGKRVNVSEETYSYLDTTEVHRKLVEFDSADFTRVRFHIPAIHCSSCIWLLEHLERLHSGIIRSEVNFSLKNVTIDYNPQRIKLSVLATILNKIGYTPRITLERADQQGTTNNNPTLIIKLAIAGFCFGNVMLFSFPEYLGLNKSDDLLMRIFSGLNFLLALPVLLFSASDYFRSAFSSFKQRQINIDVPIALGLMALFLRSTFDIITTSGPGYLDSFTGLVFFLLMGRWFQSKTYETLAFERDFKSYFPLAVHKQYSSNLIPAVIYDLERGDRIWIRNMEIIPTDSILLDKEAYIDYSFVTGESRPVKVLQEDLIYAGGRLIGQPVSMRVDKKTTQSQLTRLWNHEAFRKERENGYKRIIDYAARKFTWIVMGIALITAIYWYNTAPSQLWLVFTSVLIVACPCALALAAPFTYGSMLRVFGRNKLYLKNADVIERLATIDAIVFDKTGTVTTGQEPEMHFFGGLSEDEISWVKVLTSYSTHPLSSLISKHLPGSSWDRVMDFKEFPGKGIQAIIAGHEIKIGSYEFVGGECISNRIASIVFVSIDSEVRGYFTITTLIRKSIHEMLQRLGTKCVALVSGDNEGDRDKMSLIFPSTTQLLFNQSPHDKLEFIRTLQAQGKKVLMVGDGLNDAGALKQSDVGIAVTDDTAIFTPACDGILQGDRLNSLDCMIDLAKNSTRILKISFAISFLYNAIALSIAVTGHLTPLVAAILMPVSSISVVVFSSLAVRFIANQKIKQHVLNLNTQKY